MFFELLIIVAVSLSKGCVTNTKLLPTIDINSTQVVKI